MNHVVPGDFTVILHFPPPKSLAFALFEKKTFSGARSSGVVAGGNCPPPKFWGVGKLLEKFSSSRKIFLQNAKFGPNNPHFVEN